MIDPTGADLGRRVIYRDLGGRKLDEGVITSYNPDYVFVRYAWSQISAATRREDLEWSTRSPSETAIGTTIRGGKVVAIDFREPPEA